MTLNGLFDCIVDHFGLRRLLLLLVCVLNLHFTLFSLKRVCKVRIQHRKHFIFNQLVIALQRMNPCACLRIIASKLIFSGHVAYIAWRIDILRLLMIHLRLLHTLHLRGWILVRHWNNLTDRLLIVHVLNSLLFVEIENFVDRHHLELLGRGHLARLIKLLLIFGIKRPILRNVTWIWLVYRLNPRIHRNYSTICLVSLSKWIWILVVVEEERIGTLLPLMVDLLQT